MEEPKEVPEKPIDPLEDEVYSGVTIQYTNPVEPKKVVIGKPSKRMTKHLRPLYITTHINGHPTSIVLIDNR